MGSFSEGAGPSLIEAGGGVLSSIFNLGTAQKQMNFQERMRSTAYQTATADMIKGGLNPALMYGSAGPAPSPAGAMATAENPMRGFAQSQGMAARLKSEIAANNANAQKSMADATLAAENAKTAATTRAVNNAVETETLARSKIPASTIAEINARIREIEARVPLTNAQTAKTLAETPKPKFFGELFSKGSRLIENLENGVKNLSKKPRLRLDSKY